jgi:hypothetical protein
MVKGNVILLKNGGDSQHTSNISIRRSLQLKKHIHSKEIVVLFHYSELIVPSLIRPGETIYEKVHS